MAVSRRTYLSVFAAVASPAASKISARRGAQQGSVVRRDREAEPEPLSFHGCVLRRTAGDPQEVAGWIKDPKICQTPSAALKVVFQGPSGRHDLVTLRPDVIDLKHQLHAGGRLPPSRCGRKRPLRGPDVNLAAPQRDIRILIAALVLRDTETQNPGIEVNDDIKIVRKNLTPQRHIHLKIIARPSPPAALGR